MDTNQHKFVRIFIYLSYIYICLFILFQLVYFNHEEDVGQVMQTIFQNKAFDLPSPKLIIVLEGGLNNSSERLNDFNEKQFSTSVARLLLDIGIYIYIYIILINLDFFY